MLTADAMKDYEHERKAIALAEKITTKAEAALDGLNREMKIMQWSPEFRAIMWDAVAQVATAYSEAAKAASTEGGA